MCKIISSLISILFGPLEDEEEDEPFSLNQPRKEKHNVRESHSL
jgi:hypothetical protein